MNLVEQLSYVEAWSRWYSGAVVTEDYLWGIQILWWGRCGKIVALISGLLIIVEIIGPARLQDFSINLRNRYKITDSLKIIGYAYTAIRLYISQALSTERRKEKEGGDFLRTNIGKMTFLIWVLTIFISSLNPFSITLSALGVDMVDLSNASSIAKVGYMFGYIFLSLPMVLFSLSIITVLFSIVFSVIGLLIIHPLAWVLKREQISQNAKIFSVILLLIGFHFDLLAS